MCEIRRQAAYDKGEYAASKQLPYENPFTALFCNTTSDEEIAWSWGYNNWYHTNNHTYVRKMTLPINIPTMMNWVEVIEATTS
jgi:hypothetical protein